MIIDKKIIDQVNKLLEQKKEVLISYQKSKNRIILKEIKRIKD